MSQKTSATSSTPSSPLSINPALQTALGSLDVQLEAELARYRRQRRGRGITSPQLPGRYPKQKPGVNQLEPTTASPISIAPAADSTSSPGDIDRQSSPVSGSPTPEQRESPETEPTPPLFPPLPSQEAPLVKTQEQSVTDFPSLEESLEEDGKLVVPTTDQSQPEDYLESSEKLRQTLAEQETPKESQKPITNRILTPLGVGSILLLLVSSATLTYIFRTSLGLDFLETEIPTTAENSTATTANGENELLGVNRPNLASDDEFPDVNINTLPNLKANPTSSPSAAPIAPIPNSQPPAAAPPTASVLPLPQLPNPASNLPSALLTPPTPPPPTATPSVTPNSSPAQPESSTNKSSEKTNKSTSAELNPNNAVSNLSDEFYYVLINSSDSSVLETAQTIVPDAYVVNVPAGTRIAMGAFKLESEAKTLVERLKQQGLSASIYKPE
ncbi:MAG: hypothetical protein RID53_15615 [Coleofasciculus sp. B1-GNL1-01]|uniref:hypothetical protein n=1 Tax=Coleofasciculus sp. B1-GNL1-01 TaxID=3068484 RepID=UPI0032FAC11B